jgi:Arc-like DNA binding domain
MPKKKSPTDIGQLKLRLPEALREKLIQASDHSGRSLNNEIVWRLTKSFGDDMAIFDQHVATEARVIELLEQIVERRLSGLPKPEPKPITRRRG